MNFLYSMIYLNLNNKKDTVNNIYYYIIKKDILKDIFNNIINKYKTNRDYYKYISHNNKYTWI